MSMQRTDAEVLERWYAIITQIFISIVIILVVWAFFLGEESLYFLPEDQQFVPILLVVLEAIDMVLFAYLWLGKGKTQRLLQLLFLILDVVFSIMGIFFIWGLIDLIGFPVFWSLFFLIMFDLVLAILAFLSLSTGAFNVQPRQSKSSSRDITLSGIGSIKTKKRQK